MNKLINIPFLGFYNSIHGANIDRVLEYMIENDQQDNFDQISEFTYEFSHSKKSKEGYSKLFIDALNEEMPKGIDFVFDLVASPLEYNFHNDRIYATLTMEKIRLLAGQTDMDILRQTAIDRHTSYSGFHSFYDPDIETWGNLNTWDCNQLGTLIRAYIATELDDDYEIWLMDDAQGNGYLDELVYTCLNDTQLKMLEEEGR